MIFSDFFIQQVAKKKTDKRRRRAQSGDSVMDDSFILGNFYLIFLHLNLAPKIWNQKKIIFNFFLFSPPGEGVAVRGEEESSPFRLSTTTRDQSVDRYSWKTSKTGDSACGSTESTTSSAEPLTSLSTDSAMSMMSSSNSTSNSNNGHSYSSLKSRIKG